MIARTLFLLGVSAALAGTVLGGCGGEGSEAQSIVSIGAVSSDLTVKTLMDSHGRLMVPWAIKGTYGSGCLVHAGETWDLTLNDPTDRSLEVVLNDSFANCPLTWTGITMLADQDFYDVSVAPPIVLGLGLAPSPSAANMGMELAFYTNGELDDLNEARYTNDFTLRMVYSDDVTVCGNVAPPAVYATVTAAAEGAPIPPPDYTMDLDEIQLVVDADNIVQNLSSGDVELIAHATPGEEWKVFEQLVDCCGPYTFASIDNHFLKGTFISTGAMPGANDLVLPWTSFALEGETLPAIRNVVVKHTGEGGVYSYQLFQVLFNGPS